MPVPADIMRKHAAERARERGFRPGKARRFGLVVLRDRLQFRLVVLRKILFGMVSQVVSRESQTSLDFVPPRSQVDLVDFLLAAGGRDQNDGSCHEPAKPGFGKRRALHRTSSLT